VSCSHQHVLGTVGVLILVHQDVAEPLLIGLEHGGEGSEQLDGDHEQVVEVHRRGLDQALLVETVDVGDLFVVEPVALVGKRLVVDQLVLGVGDDRLHCLLGKALAVEIEILGDHAQEAKRVGVVVNGETRPVAKARCLPPQHAHTGRVEGAHPHGADHPTDEAGRPLLHLVGGLVGESDGQDGFG
jgi:hypothetical protein